MTKGEKSEIDEMWEEVNNVYKSLGPRSMSFLLNSVKTRQAGAVEAADRLLDTKLYSFSRQFRFVDLSSVTELKMTLKTIKEFEVIASKDSQSLDL